MDNENRSIAFVAMKFDSDPWRDTRYTAIKEELEQAGFACLRADEIRTSGPVVDEVCRLLKDAQFVVIDSSGDSQSVSYEIGYCHGIGRPANTTLLLRSDGNIPFNYRHFRHCVYRDNRHLRRLIRSYLQLSEPIQDDMYGYVFTFKFCDHAASDYVYDGVVCILDAVRKISFTGRAECYAGERFELGDRLFTVGLALRLPGRTPTPDWDWWKNLACQVTENTARYENRIRLERDLSELASKGAMRDCMLASGAAEFDNGLVIRLIGDEQDSGDPSLLSRWMHSTS